VRALEHARAGGIEGLAPDPLPEAAQAALWERGLAMAAPIHAHGALGAAFTVLVIVSPLVLHDSGSRYWLALRTGIACAAFFPAYRAIKRRIDLAFFRTTRDAATVAETLRDLKHALHDAGPARAKEMIFTGRLFPAPEAQAIGLISRVVPRESIESEVMDLAQQIATNAPLTIRAAKEMTRRLMDARNPEQGDADLIEMCYMSADFKEGVDAFLNKRKPQWTGA